MKKIKMKLTVTIACLMAVTHSSYAQGGMYLTVSDYRNRKLSYETECKIRPNNSVLNLPYITVIDHGKKQKLNKSDIYAYVDCSGKTTRFYKNEEYQIAEAGNIMIYTGTENVPQSKGFKVRRTYFFSTSPDSEIIPLTFGSLKKAYRTNDKFLDLIDQFFANGDVTEYDNIHGTYKVNYVFAKTLK